eukprot:2071164-Pyramimonas_sp.AAC.1
MQQCFYSDTPQGTAPNSEHTPSMHDHVQTMRQCCERKKRRAWKHHAMNDPSLLSSTRAPTIASALCTAVLWTPRRTAAIEKHAC